MVNTSDIYSTKQALSQIHKNTEIHNSVNRSNSFTKPLTPSSSTFNSTPRSIQKKVDPRPQRSGTAAISFNSSNFQTPQQSFNSNQPSPSPLAVPTPRSTGLSHDNYINSKVEKLSLEFMKFKGVQTVTRLTMASNDKKNSKNSELDKAETIVSKCVHGYGEFGLDWLLEVLRDLNLEIRDGPPRCTTCVVEFEIPPGWSVF